MRLLVFLFCLLTRCAVAQTLQSKPALVAIRSVLDAESCAPQRPVLLRGTITHARSPIVLQDQTGAIELRPERTFTFVSGDEAEVTGSCPLTRAEPFIQVAGIQVLWHSSPPLPLAITPDRAADGRYNLHYVQTTGELSRVDTQGDVAILNLQGDHQFFTARLQQDMAVGAQAPAVSKLEPGSTIRLNGILLASPAQYTSSGSFVLLLASPEDLEVVHGPSWWNVRHLSYLFTLALLLGGCFQVLYFQQVKRRYAAVLDERARIARDIHDTLAQGFAGIALQLEVVRAKLQQDHAAAQHLAMALRMVQHSRAEAHRSIAALRAFSRDMPLQTMLEEMVRHLQDVPGQRVDLVFEGENDQLLPPLVAENAYRIVQELVSNAQQHASASHIRVFIGIRDHLLRLIVEDNGIGMEPSFLESVPAGHFGLLGLRERVHTLHGALSVARLQQGTSFTIEIPVQGSRLSRRKGVPLGYASPVLGQGSNKQMGEEHA